MVLAGELSSRPQPLEGPIADGESTFVKALAHMAVGRRPWFSPHAPLLRAA